MNDLLGLVKGGGDAPVTEQEQHAGTSATTKIKKFWGKSKKRQSSFDIEAPAVTDGKDPDMDQFYAQVALIKALMGDIKEYQKRLENSNEKTKVAVRTAEVHALREQMQQDANTTYQRRQSRSRQRTRTAITGFEKEVERVDGRFQDLRVKLQNDYKETVERRVYTVTGEHASEEQIERMIDEGEGEMIFQNAIMEQGRGFSWIWLFLWKLKEMIDNIEAQVNSSLAQVETGVTHLAAAKQSQKRSRKMICCILIMILIAAIAVALF
eukprot:jgi/Picre1/32415/NNA_007761.t1